MSGFQEVGTGDVLSGLGFKGLRVSKMSLWLKG